VKYLVVMLVVGVVVWLLTAKARPPRGGGGPAAGADPAARRRGGTALPPQAMLSCSHCGLHLPAADAVLDGSRVYCSEAHRALGPRADTRADR
jgi:uncharacterized protein